MKSRKTNGRIPEIPAAAVRRFEAEIESDRKAGKLIKLGDTATEAVDKLRLLGRKWDKT